MCACLLCAEPPSLGLLCSRHGAALASPGLISEQILSLVTEPAASFVDPWGFPHPAAGGMTIGRETTTGLAILHPSISSLHAELRLVAGAWSIVDRGSRNGIHVDGIRLAEGAVAPGAVVGFGDVRFYFWAPALGREQRPTGRGRTAESRTVPLVFGATTTTALGVCVELRARGDGGLAKIDAETIDLARKEFALLQVLAERRALRDAEHAYVPWHEIAARLDFDSAEADSENVRALVRRVRKKLEPCVRGLIDSKHGIGYRLVGAVALEVVAAPGRGEPRG